MAKSKHSFEKRRRELEKKKKQEEKRQRKLERKQAATAVELDQDSNAKPDVVENEQEDQVNSNSLPSHLQAAE